MAILTVSEVREEGFTDPPYSDPRVQKAIDRVERYIEDVTGNWFEVRDLTLTLDGSGCEVLPLPHPIISVTSVKIWGDEVSLDDIKVYNRHLQGVLDGDDRQDPKIEFNSEFIEEYYPWYGKSRQAHRNFPRGAQNIEIVGKFGFRDYDPLNPEGKSPEGLKIPALMLIPRFLEQVASKRFYAAWRSHEVSRKSTRGTSCEFSSAVTLGKVYGGLTGDPYIDDLLSLYVRPVMGAVV